LIDFTKHPEVGFLTGRTQTGSKSRTTWMPSKFLGCRSRSSLIRTMSLGCGRGRNALLKYSISN
jgi:hypothetical protein